MISNDISNLIGFKWIKNQYIFLIGRDCYFIYDLYDLVEQEPQHFRKRVSNPSKVQLYGSVVLRSMLGTKFSNINIFGNESR